MHTGWSREHLTEIQNKFFPCNNDARFKLLLNTFVILNTHREAFLGLFNVEGYENVLKNEPWWQRLRAPFHI
jgi:hypothetical protein